MPKRKVNKKSGLVNSKTMALHLLLCGMLCIGTWLVYSGSLNNELTNWDDQEYLTNNNSIKELSSKSIQEAFKSYHMGNYHPLTMISYAIEYNIAGLEPYIYHRTNLWLHLLNTILVYVFIVQLSGGHFIALFTAGVFAFHPMHVESVVWAAERKDVLYTFFYLAALVFYSRYYKNAKVKCFTLTMLCFLLALLSKAMAVSLPLALIAIDLYNKNFNKKTLLNKIPFFLVAIVFGLIAVDAQESAKAIGEFKTYTLFERFLFVNYGLVLYLYKFFAPVNLNAFYDYPLKTDEAYPFEVYLSPLIVVVLGFIIWKYFRNSSVWKFGLVFFLVTIVMVLQILPVGGAIISERYTYLPYIGIAFILATYLEQLKNRQKHLPYILSGILLIGIAKLSHSRTKVWENSLTLWNDVIKKSPNSPKAYNNRGDAHNIRKQYKEAIEDLNKSISLKVDYPDAFYNRGLSYFYLGNYEKAIDDYTMAIKHNPELNRAYYNRSGTYYTLQQYQKAFEDAIKAKELGYPVEPQYLEALQAGMSSTIR